MTDPSVKSKVPHVHAAVIKAWADGAEIQVKLAGDSVWLDCSPTGWFRNCEYRVKPQPHKHQDLIDAFRSGATDIEMKMPSGMWVNCTGSFLWLHTDPILEPDKLELRRAHKWQKEIDAYVAGKVVQYQLSMWPTHRWQSLPEFRRHNGDETPEFQFNGAAEVIFRIKPEQATFLCRVEVPYGFSPKIMSSWQREKPTSATWQENLRLTFEDGALIGAEVLKC
jgi:hypothetical protein